jgi:hypothetical protein
MVFRERFFEGLCCQEGLLKRNNFDSPSYSERFDGSECRKVRLSTNHAGWRITARHPVPVQRLHAEVSPIIDELIEFSATPECPWNRQDLKHRWRRYVFGLMTFVLMDEWALAF